jgi:hypothetical protein
MDPGSCLEMKTGRIYQIAHMAEFILHQLVYPSF